MGNKHSSSKGSLKKNRSFKEKIQSSKENLKQLFNLAETLNTQVIVTSYPINTNGDFIMNNAPIVVDVEPNSECTPIATHNRNFKQQHQHYTINDILLQNIKQNNNTPSRIGTTPITPHDEQLKRDLIAQMYRTPQLHIDLDQVSQNAPVKPKSQPQEGVEEIFFDPRSPTIKRNPISVDSLEPFADLNKLIELSPLNLLDDISSGRHKDAILVLSKTRHNIVDILDDADIQLDHHNVVVNGSLFDDEDDDLIKKVFVMPSPIQPYDPSSYIGKEQQQTDDDWLPPSPPSLSNLPRNIPTLQQSSNLAMFVDQLNHNQNKHHHDDDCFQLVFESDFELNTFDIINLEREKTKSKNSTTPKLMFNGQRDLTSRTPKRKNSLNPTSSTKGYVSPSPLHNAISNNISINTSSSTTSTQFMTPQSPNDEDFTPQIPLKTPNNIVLNKENNIESSNKKNSGSITMNKPLPKNVHAVKNSDHNDLRAKSIQRLDGVLGNISNRPVR